MSYTVFGKPNCPYCVRAKDLLESKNLEYKYFDIAVDEVYYMQMNEYVKNATGSPARTVPQIFIGEKYIGGFDDLVKSFTEVVNFEDFEDLGGL